MAQKNNNLVHLEKLAEHYSVILPDTSVINQTFRMPLDSLDLKERRYSLVKQVDLGNTFLRRISGFPNVLFTPGVLSEIGNFNGGIIHSGERLRRAKYGENVSLVMRASRDLFKSRQRLFEYIQREGKVINLNPDETEAVENYKEYYHILTDRYGLSEIDFELLMYGLVVSQTRESCVILSHDRGIHHLWKDILHLEGRSISPNEMQFGKEELSPKNFGLFVRIKSDGFEEQNCKGFRTYF